MEIASSCLLAMTRLEREVIGVFVAGDDGIGIDGDGVFGWSDDFVDGQGKLLVFTGGPDLIAKEFRKGVEYFL